MTKYEVMSSLRKEFDEYIFPYYTRKIFPKLQASLSQKCMREKRMISIGWEMVPSSVGTNFSVLKRGDNEGDKPIFINEFRWREKKCYANFFKEGYIVVYPAHCLQRYSERVLKDNLDIEVVFKNHLIKRQESAFNIVLPTPTHKYSQYVGFADALFLGDFDEKHPKTSFLWLNTCISYDETGYSQSKIMKSLHEMQKYVNGVKIDFSDIKNKKVLQQYIKKNSTNIQNIENLKQYLIQKTLLWKLHLSYNFEFTELFREDIEIQLEYLKNILSSFDIHQLSPFSLTHGIAKKGEIDYMEH